jgi:hypothetical protein
LSKIRNYEKKLRDKYEELKILESFSNPINQILVQKIKDYQINVLNSKISNQDVFFNNEKETKKVFLVLIKFNKSNKNKSFTISDNNLNKNDKKEIIKSFLEDEEVKKYIYEMLYEN